MRINSILCFVMCAAFLSACASSHKILTDTSCVFSDSLAASMANNTRQGTEKRDSASLIVSDSLHSSTSIMEDGSNEETITEHVTENMDADGSKTTTTDRVIHRKVACHKQTDMQDSQIHHEDKSSVLWNRWDSLANSRLNVWSSRWVKKDSLNEVREKNTDGLRTCKNGRHLSLCLMLACFVFFLLKIYRRKE